MFSLILVRVMSLGEEGLMKEERRITCLIMPCGNVWVLSVVSRISV